MSTIIISLLTSLAGSGILTAVLTNFFQRNHFIYEKKHEAFTNIYNCINNVINNLSYSQENDSYTQISEAQYKKLKDDTDKFSLYLNRNDTDLLAKIIQLFAHNVYLEYYAPVGFPNFNEKEIKEIKMLCGKLKADFRKELSLCNKLLQ
ncbi:hypothetical protein AGMMS50267_17040 [Spirochaetia bacterium]|nr:hypothetical protein AGMMS50267_17040 [Spirochaetia bacterium]